MWKIVVACFVSTLLVGVPPTYCNRTTPSTSNNICLQPKDVGPCRAAFPRFYYNAFTENCESFSYGGCQGNENNFETITECKKKCWTDNTCILPAVTGPCKANYQRYYYNSTSRKCHKFVYGGCEGNRNNFVNGEECERKCQYALPPVPRRQPEFCQLPSDGGLCLALFIKYYYNAQARECQTFTFGGCGGNANNFNTKDECQRTCVVY